jgi:hypothetical protein
MWRRLSANAPAAVGSNSATTLTPVRVSTLNRLHLAVVNVKSNATITTATTGWTKMRQDNSGTGFTTALFFGRNTPANPVFTWTGAAACGAVILSLVNDDNPEDATAFGAITVTSGTGTTHTSSPITSTRVGSLALCLDTCAANTAVSAVPGWTEYMDLGPSAGANRFMANGLELPNVGDTSNAISVTGGNAAWLQYQIEIMIAAPASGLQFNSANLDVVTKPPPGLLASSVNLDVVAEPPPGLLASSLNLNVVVAPGLYPRRRMIHINDG